MSAASKGGKRADVHIALLRGVNVGGANRLAMSELKAIFEAVGCRDVETVIQSGNVVFSAEPDAAQGLSAAVAAKIQGRFGFLAPVILRSAADFSGIVKSNPFLAAGADPATLHVMCLASEPATADVAALDALRSPPDEFIVRGRDIYLRLPNGVARSKLSNAYFDRALQTIGTGRNWRTMTRIGEIAGL